MGRLCVSRRAGESVTLYFSAIQMEPHGDNGEIPVEMPPLAQITRVVVGVTKTRRRQATITIDAPASVRILRSELEDRLCHEIPEIPL